MIRFILRLTAVAEVTFVAVVYITLNEYVKLLVAGAVSKSVLLFRKLWVPAFVCN